MITMSAEMLAVLVLVAFILGIFAGSSMSRPNILR